ncbi:MAG TPA: ABC transporter ATP-binding protein [Halanaerobiales bacterium]|nr:ABC transporter ATP-binding protein [Halanaerobiales bacterium]
MLEVKNLGFSYNKVKTINNINFRVKRQEFSCLLGANGSGKTTILKCLNGVLEKDEGKIKIDQTDLDELNQRQIAQYVSMVPQEHSVVFSYRVLDVVTMGATPYLGFGKMPGQKHYERALKILKKLDIEYLADRQYNQLSGGEKQLILIARALMQDTGYLIMDEPTSHLDFKNKNLLMREIKKLTRNSNTGVIMALHDPNLALKYCDRVIIVKDGSIMADGDTNEIMTGRNLGNAYGIDIKINEKARGIEIALPEI